MTEEQVSGAIPPPPARGVSRRRSLLEAKPKIEEQSAPDHLSTPTDGGYRNFVDLGFKVEPWKRRRFAVEAVLRGLSKKDLFWACFQAYLEANGGTLEKAIPDEMVSG